MAPLALLLLFLSLLPRSGVGWPARREANTTVTTSEEFVLALNSSRVTIIEVSQDLLMSEDMWPAEAVFVGRNLTVRSAPGGGQRLINFTMVRDKVTAGPGVHLIFENLFMSGLSAGPNVVVARDWASNRAVVSASHGALQPGPYTSMMVNIVVICALVFTDACVAQKGYPACRSEAHEALQGGASDTLPEATYTSILVVAGLLTFVVACAAVLGAMHKLGGSARASYLVGGLPPKGVKAAPGVPGTIRRWRRLPTPPRQTEPVAEEGLPAAGGTDSSLPAHSHAE